MPACTRRVVIPPLATIPLISSTYPASFATKGPLTSGLKARRSGQVFLEVLNPLDIF
jgi:hypothetical protein